MTNDSRFGTPKGNMDSSTNQAKVVIEPQFDKTWGFSEGLAAVKVDDK